MQKFVREYFEILAEGSDGRWAYSRCYRNAAGLIEYVCRHMDSDASLDDIHWHIWKYTYTGNDWDVIQEKIGSVTGRAALGWV